MSSPKNNVTSNLFDEFEESCMDVMELLAKSENNYNSFEEDETCVDIDVATNKFHDRAQQMEAFFLQRRFILSVLKPNLILEEEVINLRNEIKKKDMLLQKFCNKVDHWQMILSSAPQTWNEFSGQKNLFSEIAALHTSSQEPSDSAVSGYSSQEQPTAVVPGSSSQEQPTAVVPGPSSQEPSDSSVPDSLSRELPGIPTSSTVPQDDNSQYSNFNARERRLKQEEIWTRLERAKQEVQRIKRELQKQEMQKQQQEKKIQQEKLQLQQEHDGWTHQQYEQTHKKRQQQIELQSQMQSQQQMSHQMLRTQLWEAIQQAMQPHQSIQQQMSQGTNNSAEAGGGGGVGLTSPTQQATFMYPGDTGQQPVQSPSNQAPAVNPWKDYRCPREDN